MAEDPFGRDNRQLYTNRTTKICYFHKDGDPRAKGIKVAVNPKHYSTIEALQDDLTHKIDGLPFGVRSIYTPMGRDCVRTTEDLQDHGKYVCSTHPSRARGVDVQRLERPKPWYGGGRPSSGKRALYDLLRQERAVERMKKRRMGESVSPTTWSNSSDKPPSYLSKSPRTPKRITVMKNGHPQTHHILLINRNTLMSFEQVLNDIGVMFHMPAQKLFTADGRHVKGLTELINGPDNYVICGTEKFVPLTAIPEPPSNGKKKRRPGPDAAKDGAKPKRDRQDRTKGRWQVVISTNDLPSAGTNARVTLTAYGDQGNSGPILLGEDDEDCFQPGNSDQFDIDIGKIGELFKIRLAHDNTGDCPGYLCNEVRMRDIDTGEELQFTCGRWMSREEDDGEICREMPVQRAGENVLPVYNYQVMLVTGDVWNAGTSANIYLTMYGDNGDTGVRHLIHSSNSHKFLKGQTDLFSVEAVSLGEIKRVTVGHDGEGPGSGWYLEKITIKESPKARKTWIFPCRRWLDESEDDGKIVRDLKSIHEYRQDVFEKQQFAYEKWKLQPNCQVMLFSSVTGKALRVKADGSLDLTDDFNDPQGVFNVILKKGMIRSFQSASDPASHLTIENGKPSAQGSGGAACEFKVLVQEDRTIMLELSKHPGHFLCMGSNGKPLSVNEIKLDLCRFFLYCKGMFRDQGVVMLCTSVIQALNINDNDSNNTLSANGKPNQLAQFKVHKVSPGVRMFESIVYPQKYIRCKNDLCDVNGTGDKFCQFRVEKKKEKGYVTLESLANKGHCLGMTEDGTVKPTVFTGAKNMRFFPEVIEFGARKTAESVVSESPVPVPIKPLKHRKLRRRTPTPDRITTRSQASLATTAVSYEEGEWKIVISTQENAKNAEVILMVYGDQGVVGPVLLGSSEDGLFQIGQSDEFKVNLLDAGVIYKIRLELQQTGDASPSWKVKVLKMKNMNTKETLTFKFNRWLSRSEDDLDIARELPAVRPGQQVLKVTRYKVEVYTGREAGADTDANVYIQLFGERGDTGKRGLVKSDQSEMFQEGQVDVFEVEAVDLGELTHCVIGHDADGVGEGWLCEKIVILSQETDQEWLFVCNKWLDSGLGDGKTERSLKRTEAKLEPEVEVDHEPPADAEEGDWEVWVTTGTQSDFSTFFDVHLYVYGSEGDSGPLVINAYDEVASQFEPGSTDHSRVNFRDLGELYKIRVGSNFTAEMGNWFIEKMKLQNCLTRETLMFECQRWLSLEKDDCDTWREFPVISPGHDPLPIVVYTLEVYTGTIRGASTRATVKAQLIGSRGDSGLRELHKTLNKNKTPFKAGQLDVFQIEAVSLDEIEALVLEHDAQEPGAGWYLDHVIVKEGRYEDIKAIEEKKMKPVVKNGRPVKPKGKAQPEIKMWFFSCQRWFDAGEDDGLIRRELHPGSQPDTSGPAPPAQDKPSKGEWQVLVTSGKQSEMGSHDKVQLWVYGDRDTAGPLPLGEDNPTSHYKPGATDDFKVKLASIGAPYKIRIGYDPADEEVEDSHWFIDKIIMKDLTNNEKLTFKVQQWLSRQKEDRDTWRELAVVRPGKDPLPVITYTVEVYTGQLAGSDTEAQPYIQLFGSRGDSGRRLLIREVTGNTDLFQQGQMDVFEIQAVSLDDLNKVLLGHNDSSIGGGWYVDHVVIKEGSYKSVKAIDDRKAKLKNKKAKEPANKQKKDKQAEDYRAWYFPCAQWLDKGIDDGLTERELTPADALSDETPPPEGNWKVTVVTGEEEDMSLRESEVLLYVYGSRDQSDPIPLGKEDRDKYFHPGAADDFDISVKNLGEIYKIRIGYFPDYPDEQWFLEKLTMKNMEDNLQLSFTNDRWLSLAHDDCDTWRELPAVYPGKQPLQVITYTVEVYTGSEPGAGTDAQPYVHLFGKRGDSGRRLLFKDLTGSKRPFQAGHKAIFELQAVDLDDIDKIVLGHDGHGKGAGWYCEKVVVREGAYEGDDNENGNNSNLYENCNNNANKGKKPRAWEFPVNAWMDEGMGDGKLEVEVQGQPLDEDDTDKDLHDDLDNEPDEVIEEPPDDVMEEVSDENWQVTVVTGEEDNMALRENQVQLFVYGTEKTAEGVLLGQDGRQMYFHAGANDRFDINLDELGEIYKIRIGYNPEITEDGWYLEKVTMKCIENDEILDFPVERWLSQSEDDCDTWRELPAVYPSKDPLPVVIYTVEVYTGQLAGSGTEAQPYIQLFGSRGDSGRRLLFKEHSGNKKAFQKGQMDVFQVEAVSLDDIQSVLLGHDGHGSNAAWYVDHVIVKEGSYSSEQAFDEKKKKNVEKEKQGKEKKGKEDKKQVKQKGKEKQDKDKGDEDGKEYRTWYFPCSKWFDVCMENGHIERMLTPRLAPEEGERMLTPGLPLEEDEQAPEGDWQVTVVTGPEDNMALTQNEVLLYVYGTRNTSEAIPLGQQDREKYFHPGASNLFNLSFGDVGEIYKIRVGYFAEEEGDGWFLEKISLKHIENLDVLNFSVERWLSQSEDDCDTWRELPAVYPGKDPLPVVIYTVEVYTGQLAGSDTEAQPYIQLFGSRGDSGRRLLFKEHSGNKKPFQKGQMDVFQVEAVSLDDIQSVLLGHDGHGKGAGWFVDHVVIKEGSYEEVSTADERKKKQDARDKSKKGKKGKEIEDKKGKKGKESKDKKGKEEEEEYRKWYLPCSRWFDEGMEDGCIERVLEPGNPPQEDEIAPEGDWQVTVVTGPEDNMALTQNEVLLYVYGTRNTSEAIPLGQQDREKYFHPGASDFFDITLGELGEIYKIRIGYFAEVPDDGWFLEKVTLKHIEEGDELHFTSERWLSQAEDDFDTWREMPAVYPAKDPLPVVIYTVEVYTGQLPGSDTEAQPYIQLFGSRGDSGRRLLYKEHSGNKKPFRKGQMDVFQVEAVSLDDIQSLLLGHDSHGKGAGWYVDHIVVKEGSYEQTKAIDERRGQRESSNLNTNNHNNAGQDKKGKEREQAAGNAETEEYRMWYFPCGRWFDGGMEDNKTERFLTPGDLPQQQQDEEEEVIDDVEEIEELREETQEENEEEEKPKGSGKLWVKTAEDSKAANDSHMVLVVYGDQGKSDNIILHRDGAFAAGNTDEFDLALEDLGELYKIRVERAEGDSWEGWHLDEVKLQDSSSQEYIFKFDRWMDRSQDDHDVVRELPFVKEGQDPLPMQHYEVMVYTGDHWAAGTDANAYITLYGSLGDSGKRMLYHTDSNPTKFLRNQVDSFIVEAVSLEKLQKVELGHDGQGHGAGWYVEKVVIKEKEGDNTHMEYVFPCGRWLDDQIGDKLTCLTLLLKDEVDSTVAPAAPEDVPSTGEWKVQVKTGDEEEAGTSAQVYITGCGTSATSDPQPLSLPGNGDFNPSNEAEFTVQFGEIGELQKIRLEHDNSGDSPGWLLEQIVMTDTQTKEILKLYVNRWLAEDKEDSMTCREFHLARPLEPTRQSLLYQVAIVTGNEPEGGTSAEVSINIVGEYGESGFRRLPKSLTCDEPFQPGQTDVFHLDAVHLGRLDRVLLKHDGKVPETKWQVEKVIVKEATWAVTQAVFCCGDWVSPNSDPQYPGQAVQLTAYEFATELPPYTEGKTPPASSGKWTLWTYTGDEDGSGPDADVSVVIIGSKGESQAFPLSGDASPAGEGDEEDKDTKDEDKSKDKNGQDKEKKDQDNKDKKGQDKDKKDQDKNKDKKGQDKDKKDQDKNKDKKGQDKDKKDQDKNKDKKGQDKDKNEKTKDKKEKSTVNKEEAETDENSGEKLRPGSVDEFKLSCGDIGEVYKIRITINKNGTNPAWYIKKLKMKDDQTGQEFHFLYNSWFKVTEDTPEGVLELPAIRPDIEPFRDVKYTISLSTGVLPRADTDAEIHCTLVGPFGNTGSRLLKKSKNNDIPFSLGQVDEFAEIRAVDVGPIEKVILGHKSQGRGNGWYCERLSIYSDLDEGTELIFPVNSWFDTGCQDRLTERTLTSPILVKSEHQESKGPWKCMVTMATESDLQDVREKQKDDSHGSDNEQNDSEDENESSTVKAKSEKSQLQKSQAEKSKSEKSKSEKSKMNQASTDKENPKDSEEMPKVTGVRLTFVGEQGSSEVKDLLNDDPEAFDLGKISEFEVTSEEVGMLQKLRLECMLGPENSELWLVKKVTLTDQLTQEVIVLDLSQIIGHKVSQCERPVPHSGTNIPPVLEYNISLHLKQTEKYENQEEDNKKQEHAQDSKNKSKEGKNHAENKHDKSKDKKYIEKDKRDNDRADTNDEEPGEDDKPLMLKLVGKNGDSGFRKVPAVTEASAQPVVEMTVHAVDLGDLEKLCLSTRSAEIEKITVLPHRFAPRLYVFQMTSMEGSEDEAEVPVTRVLPHAVAVPVDEQPDHLPRSEGTWKVKTVTGSDEGAGATGPVVMVVCGQQGETPAMPLTGLTPGAENECDLVVEDIGDIFKIRFGFQQDKTEDENKKKSKKKKKDSDKDETKAMSWFVDKVHFEDTVTHDWFEIEINDWIRLDEHSDGWREFPVQWPAISLPQVVKYEVLVKTSDTENAGTKANVYVMVIGNQGTTGKRLLKQSNQNSLFQQGQVDVFEIEACDLLDPVQVIVGHDAKDAGAGWLLDSIVIRKKDEPEQEFLFKNNRWLDTGEDEQLIERVLELSPPDPPPEKNWRVVVTVSDVDRVGTDAPVTLTVFGDKGDTGPLLLQGDAKFQRGASDDFMIHIDEDKVGKISKIRIQHSDSTAEADLHLAKVELESMDGETKLEFPIDRWLSSAEDDGDVVREVPAVWPDEDGKPVTKYSVEVETGGESRAPADSKIHITLVGENGDSGKRYLNRNKDGSTKFQKNNVDVFSLEAVDLGPLVKVIIGYDQFEDNSAWQCTKIVVKEMDETSEQYHATPDQWFDNEDEGMTEQELELEKIPV